MWTLGGHQKHCKEKVSKTCNLTTFYGHTITQNYHNNFNKDLFNLVWNVKDRNSNFYSKFEWDKLWFFRKFLFLDFYVLGFNVLWNGPSEFSDTLLVPEILVIKPHQFTPKSKKSGQAWTEIGRNVIKALEIDYVVLQRSGRDRFIMWKAQSHATKLTESNELDKALDLIEHVAESNVLCEKVTE